MKTYRLKFLTVLIFLISVQLSAQEYKISAPSGRDGKVILKNFSHDLPVQGYNGTEIVMTSPESTIAPPERAKGLKPIYPAGTDNTGFGVSVEKNGNNVIITCLLPFTRGESFSFRIPENLAIEMESGCENSANISVTGMKNEIVVKSCHGVELKNITGPVVISSISGDVNVSFMAGFSDKPSSINAISGDVDITLPSKAPVSMDLSTMQGGFYSDFEISDSKKNMKRIGGSNLNFDLNGGGLKFSVVTITGNVYLRKGV